MLKSNKKNTFDTRAMESLFAKTDVNTLLEKVRENVTSNCTTIEQCDELGACLHEETAKFNECMEKMIVAAEEFKTGKIDKEGMMAVIKPAVAELKASCKILCLDEGSDDDEAPSDEEVANLRAFILGANEIIAQHKVSLSTAVGDTSTTPNGDDVTESFISTLTEMKIAPATEALDLIGLAIVGTYAAMYAVIIAAGITNNMILKSINHYAKAERDALNSAWDDALRALKIKDFKKAVMHIRKAMAAADKIISKINSSAEKSNMKRAVKTYVIATKQNMESRIVTIENKAERLAEKASKKAAKDARKKKKYATESYSAFDRLFSAAFEEDTDLDESYEEDIDDTVEDEDDTAENVTPKEDVDELIEEAYESLLLK